MAHVHQYILVAQWLLLMSCVQTGTDKNFYFLFQLHHEAPHAENSRDPGRHALQILRKNLQELPDTGGPPAHQGLPQEVEKGRDS